MIDEIARYSDADLAEFKELIIKKIQHKRGCMTNMLINCLPASTNILNIIFAINILILLTAWGPITAAQTACHSSCWVEAAPVVH